MREGGKSMKEIALECGYPNQNYFGRVFTFPRVCTGQQIARRSAFICKRSSRLAVIFCAKIENVKFL